MVFFYDSPSCHYNTNHNELQYFKACLIEDVKRAREASRKEILISLKSLSTPRRKQGKGILSQKNSLCRSVERSMQMCGHAHARTHHSVLQPREIPHCSPDVQGFV